MIEKENFTGNAELDGEAMFNKIKKRHSRWSERSPSDAMAVIFMLSYAY